MGSSRFVVVLAWLIGMTCSQALATVTTFEVVPTSEGGASAACSGMNIGPSGQKAVEMCRENGYMTGSSCKGCGWPGGSPGVMSCKAVRSEWRNNPPGVTSCIDLVSQIHTDFIYRVIPCPVGTHFEGPTASGCVSDGGAGSGSPSSGSDQQGSIGADDDSSPNNPSKERCPMGSPGGSWVGGGTSSGGGGTLPGRGSASGTNSSGGSLTGGGIDQVGTSGGCGGGTGNGAFGLSAISGVAGTPSLGLTFNSLNPTDSNDSGTGVTHSQGSRLTIQTGLKII